MRDAVNTPLPPLTEAQVIAREVATLLDVGMLRQARERQAELIALLDMAASVEDARHVADDSSIDTS